MKGRTTLLSSLTIRSESGFPSSNLSPHLAAKNPYTASSLLDSLILAGLGDVDQDLLTPDQVARALAGESVSPTPSQRSITLRREARLSFLSSPSSLSSANGKTRRLPVRSTLPRAPRSAEVNERVREKLKAYWAGSRGVGGVTP
jgi:hypothetical protein